METVVSALIIIGILILVVFSAAFYMLNTQAAISDSSRVMQARMTDRARTGMTLVSTVTDAPGDYAQIILQNTGMVKQSDLKNWDVIVQYTDALGGFHAGWYTYPISWTAQIYQTLPSQLETIEPGILNPGEYLAFQIHLVPPAKTGTTNLATITTPNGVTLETIFSH